MITRGEKGEGLDYSRSKPFGHLNSEWSDEGKGEENQGAPLPQTAWWEPGPCSVKLGGCTKGNRRTLLSPAFQMAHRKDGVPVRSPLPCISRVPNELQSLAPLYPDTSGFGATPCSPSRSPLLATDNTQDPVASVRNFSHPHIHLCSQLCPVVPRKCRLCSQKQEPSVGLFGVY